MENVRMKLLESKISGAKKCEVSFGSYRGMILDSSNEVEAAVSWIRTIQKKCAIHRREKGMVIEVSLDGLAEGPITHLTLFVGKYGISISMEGGLPKPIEIFLQRPRGIFFSGYGMLEKKYRLEKQTGITISNVLERKQKKKKKRAVFRLRLFMLFIVPNITIENLTLEPTKVDLEC
ncbi:hypothetical protein AAC387_Pa08g2337 [Persea americana]